MVQEELLLQDDDRGLQTILAEHPEVKVLWERRAGLTGPVEINGINPIMHVLLEGMVENQLNDPEIPEVREVLARLVNSGLSRHAARAVIAEVFTSHFYDVMKNKRPFDREKYIRQIGRLGKDAGKTGRNEPCPCGSGLKFKRCCGSFNERARPVSPMAGRLVLGQGSYILGVDLPNIDDPLHPLYQLENRVHIARFLKKQGDIEGAVRALQENIELAQAYDEKGWLSNALYDMLDLCLNQPSLSVEGLAAIEKLLPLVDGDSKGFLLCDRADITARSGQVAEGDRMFWDILETMPGWHFGRYRYALYLEETGRKEQAIAVLRDLVAAKELIDPETYQAAVKVLEDFTST